MPETFPELVDRFGGVVDDWDLAKGQYRDWLAGTINGGPNGDGYYPLTDASGGTYLYPCIAKIQALASALSEPFGTADDWAAVAAADADVPAYGTLFGIYVGGAGNLVLKDGAADPVSMAVAAGQIVQAGFTQVRAASTATGLVVLYKTSLASISHALDPIAPADGDFADGAVISLWVGGAGSVVARSVAGHEATFANVPAKSELPIRALAVKAASTATNITGFR